MSNDLYFYENTLKLIRERRQSVEDTLLEGPVADLTAFKELRARLSELAAIEQGLKDLLDRITYD
tara:strand:+ start:5346 stop:5540 length:195 start_codon:yes stop_codon:yes gene_type:complete